MLSDGGIQGNLPLHYLTEDECQESLSLAFSNGSEKRGNPQDFMGFVNSIFSCLIHFRNEACLRKWNHKILKISVDEYPSWNFEASRDDRMNLLKKGATSAIDWCKSKSGDTQKPIRRYSI